MFVLQLNSKRYILWEGLSLIKVETPHAASKVADSDVLAVVNRIKEKFNYDVTPVKYKKPKQNKPFKYK